MMLEINSCAIADASRLAFFDGLFAAGEFDIVCLALLLLLLLLTISSLIGLLATDDAFFDECLLLVDFFSFSSTSSEAGCDDFTFFFFREADDDSMAFSSTSFVLAGGCSSDVDFDRDLRRDDDKDEERSFDSFDFDDDDFFSRLVDLVSFSSSESESSNRPLGIMDGVFECDFDGDFDDDYLCFDLWVLAAAEWDDLDGAAVST